MTYSIVARDAASGHLGAAVQSAWFGAASALLVEPGVGAVTSQAMGERAFAYNSIALLAAGTTPDDAIAEVMNDNVIAPVSQVGVLDLTSTPAAFTGSSCVPHAGHVIGTDCVAQANMMANVGVPEAMVRAFESATGDLTHRMLDALDAAQALGGDFRGMQSAGVIIRTGERDAPMWETTIVDLRVDDHPEPLHELRRLVGINELQDALNTPATRLATGDRDGAVALARELLESTPADGNTRMRLGLVLLVAGEPDGVAILSQLAQQNEQWIVYARRVLERVGVNAGPFLDNLDLS